MINTSDYIRTTSREYATYVMEQRAIPTMTDGLKSSQRIALWLLRDQTKPIKTAGLVGGMMASGLYAHGDASAADAISRLAAPYLNNKCLVKGEGAFGTRTAPLDGIGAPRYTEVKRSKFAVDHLYVDLDTCPMQENYDGSKKMPRTFLPRLPLVLLNGASGIAIGFACKILPRDLQEIREAVVEVLETGSTNHRLTPSYDRYNVDVVECPKTKGKFFISGKVEIRNTTTVVITELPYGKSLDSIKSRLIQLEEDKKISSFVDNSTDAIDITVKMTRANLNGKTEGSLLVMFGLIQTETENITVLDPTGTKVVKYPNAASLVKDFVEWRLQQYLHRYEYLLGQEIESSLYWSVYVSCFEQYNGGKSVAENISNMESKSALRDAISEAARQSIEQDIPDGVIERVATLPAYKFTKDERITAVEKLKESRKKILEYTRIVKSPTRRKKIYLSEVS